MCQYGPDRGASEFDQLSKLKTRHCGVDIEMMRDEVKTRNEQYDKYQDFDTLFLPNMTFAKALAYVVKEHNLL